jgi:hypothetical protein
MCVLVIPRYLYLVTWTLSFNSCLETVKLDPSLVLDFSPFLQITLSVFLVSFLNVKVVMATTCHVTNRIFFFTSNKWLFLRETESISSETRVTSRTPSTLQVLRSPVVFCSVRMHLAPTFSSVAQSRKSEAGTPQVRCWVNTEPQLQWPQLFLYFVQFYCSHKTRICHSKWSLVTVVDCCLF